MRFYDSETLRQLALVQEDPTDRAATLRAALDLALTQGIAFIELRIALDLRRETGDDEPLRLAVARFPASASYAVLDDARALVDEAARPPR
jgi:hypothetical protein